MRSGLTSDPSVVHGIRSQVTRYQAVRVRLRPFGTKGSQVQILSPRHWKPPELLAKAEGSGASAFTVREGPRHRRATAPRRRSPGVRIGPNPPAAKSASFHARDSEAPAETCHHLAASQLASHIESGEVSAACTRAAPLRRSEPSGTSRRKGYGGAWTDDLGIGREPAARSESRDHCFNDARGRDGRPARDRVRA